jgi:hypothetical protein
MENEPEGAQRGTRVSSYLPEDAFTKLVRIAWNTRRSKSSIIADAIRAYKEPRTPALYPPEVMPEMQDNGGNTGAPSHPLSAKGKRAKGSR